MIARLEGILVERTPTRVILDVQGVGYEVFVPLSTFAALPDEGKVVALRVHTHAREGAIQLFGFASEVERTAFELLLRASRVGPRLAQTVLSGIAPADLLRAIRDGDPAPLRSVPGVGTKVADRILVELRDRADELELSLRASGVAPADATSAPEGRQQALSALQNLGYAKAQAERALDGLDGLDESSDVELWVRGALQRLAR